MSIPKKGTRKIIVDGEPFIWLIRRQATYTQAYYDCGNLHIAIEHAEKPGSVLVILTDRPHPQGLTPTNEVKPVTPSDTAQWIRQAVQIGWQPQLPGITFEVRIAGLFVEKI
ncbi:hypothetical protein QUA62_26775 [Microcoleus sp. MON1_C1]|jgi:hypothetical protein|uniref:hypothetical protein n=1 Tax=Microcoleus sp. MON1_C1 TaxID=2818827 RepID=UPI002FD57BA0